MQKNMICFEQVNKFILSGVSLYIPSGAFVGIIGPSGAGKTTLMKLACGLLQPDKGQVYTMEEDPIRGRKRIGKQAGVFFSQIRTLQGEETVHGNFENLRAIYRLKEADFQREYGELAERLGFRELLSEKVKNLSLGQRRRVELGAVLLHRPSLLLLDEPTAGLDLNAKAAFYQILEERNREGATIVLTSHDMIEITQLCHRIVLLDRGKLCYYGDREMLLKKYAPMDKMELTLTGEMPDMEDLPINRYTQLGDKLTIIYNSNHITAAEILRFLLQQTSVAEVNIHKPDLADVILQLPDLTQKKEREENE